MYKYVEDKTFLKNMKSLCSDIVNQLVQRINNDDVMTVKAYLVGSGARNLITQNAEKPIDLDYNIEILKVNDININDGRAIKEYIKEQFNFVLSKFKLDDCQDSTSALTTNLISFKKGNKTGFKIDLAIVRKNCNTLERLIHYKTGFTCYDKWIWNMVRQSNEIDRKVKAIKDNDLWLDVRETYLLKKNMYLQANDIDHHSFNIYIETINEVYYKNFF